HVQHSGERGAHRSGGAAAGQRSLRNARERKETVRNRKARRSVNRGGPDPNVPNNSPGHPVARMTGRRREGLKIVRPNSPGALQKESSLDELFLLFCFCSSSRCFLESPSAPASSPGHPGMNDRRHIGGGFRHTIARSATLTRIAKATGAILSSAEHAAQRLNEIHPRHMDVPAAAGGERSRKSRAFSSLRLSASGPLHAIPAFPRHSYVPVQHRMP